MNQLETYSLLKFLRLLIIMTFIRVSETVGSISLSLTSPTINTNSIYQFSITDPNLSTNSGSISIIFPQSHYSITSVSCFNTNDNTQIYTPSYPNSYTVKFAYTIPSPPSQILAVSIDSLPNPSSVQSL